MSFRIQIRVGYGDTDQGGVVHHSVYVRYLEAARVEYLRAHGVDYRLLELDSKLALPVAEAQLKYRRPAYFDDLLDVECWVGRLTRASIRFDYRIWKGTELLTEAQITLACVKLGEMRLCSMPAVLHEACKVTTGE